jgi:glycyl-tRNA synthetase beta chain
MKQYDMAMLSSFFIEIRSEEIPARLQKNAQDQALRLCTAFLDKHGISYDPSVCQAFSTPCRMIISVPKVEKQSQDIHIEKRGPRVGAPDQAIEGFCRGQGIETSDLIEEETAKGRFFFYRSIQKGQDLSNLMIDLMQTVITGLRWPKSMRWGSGKFEFIRPIQQVYACLDQTVIAGDLTVNGDVISMATSVSGQRFFADDQGENITSFDDYVTYMKKNYVDIDRSSRRDKIIQQTNDLCQKHDLVWKKDDHKIQEEVVGLVEYPVALMGKMDDKFLDLPKEVLITSMKNHQKYIPLLHKNGDLSPYFVVVVPTPQKAAYDHIVAGHEKVLRARLNDARFFYDNDQKQPISQRSNSLSQIIEHADIGTMQDKVERMQKLWSILMQQQPAFVDGASSSAIPASASTATATAGDMSATTPAIATTTASSTSAATAAVTAGDTLQALQNKTDAIETAIRISKNDLVSEMVYEFPELQGIMGSYYAMDEYGNDHIARMIKNQYHYQQESHDQFADHIVGFVDKLDTLLSMFAVGIKPTGDKDPYGLRRAIYSVMRCLLSDGAPDWHLLHIFDAAADLYKDLTDNFDGFKRDLQDFYMQRCKKFLQDYYGRTPYADIVIRAFQNAHLQHYTLNTLCAIIDYLQESISGVNRQAVVNIVQAANRAANILKKSFGQDLGEKLSNGGLLAGRHNEFDQEIQKKIDQIGGPYDIALKDQMIAVYDVLNSFRNSSENGTENGTENDSRDGFRNGFQNITKDWVTLYGKGLMTLADQMAIFFENVMINDDDADVRDIRQQLVTNAFVLFYQLSHFASIDEKTLPLKNES